MKIMDKELIELERQLVTCIMKAKNNKLLDILQPFEKELSDYLRNRHISW